MGNRKPPRHRTVRHRRRTVAGRGSGHGCKTRVGTGVERLGSRAGRLAMTTGSIIANGQAVEAAVPCSIEEFLVARGLLPRSVVVEHNGEAVAPSQFSDRIVRDGDRLEIVKIVVGG